MMGENFSCKSYVRRIAMAKAAFIKKRALFTRTLDLELRKKLSELLHLERRKL